MVGRDGGDRDGGDYTPPGHYPQSIQYRILIPSISHGNTRKKAYTGRQGDVPSSVNSLVMVHFQ